MTASNVYPVAFHNLPAKDFPFTITAHRTSDGAEVWRRIVLGPGRIHIPAIATMVGEKVTMRFHFPDGKVLEG